MMKWKLQQRYRKYKEVPKRSNIAEEYNKWTDTYFRGVQQQMRQSKINDNLFEERAEKLSQTAVERKKNEKN